MGHAWKLLKNEGQISAMLSILPNIVYYSYR